MCEKYRNNCAHCLLNCKEKNQAVCSNNICFPVPCHDVKFVTVCNGITFVIDNRNFNVYYFVNKPGDIKLLTFIGESCNHQLRNEFIRILDLAGVNKLCDEPIKHTKIVGITFIGSAILFFLQTIYNGDVNKLTIARTQTRFVKEDGCFSLYLVGDLELASVYNLKIKRHRHLVITGIVYDQIKRRIYLITKFKTKNHFGGYLLYIKVFNIAESISNELRILMKLDKKPIGLCSIDCNTLSIIFKNNKGAGTTVQNIVLTC